MKTGHGVTLSSFAGAFVASGLIGFTTFMVVGCGSEKRERTFVADPVPEPVFTAPPVPAPIVAGTVSNLQAKPYEGKFSLKSVECVQGVPTSMARAEMELLSLQGRNYSMNPFHEGSVNSGGMASYNVRRTYEWTIQGNEAVKLIKTNVSVGGQSSVMTISKRYGLTIKSTGQLVLLHGNYDTATYQGFNFDPLFQLIQQEFTTKAGDNNANTPTGLWGHFKNFVSNFFNLNKYAVNLFQEVSGIEETVSVSTSGNEMVFSNTFIRHPGFTAITETKAYDVSMCGLNGAVKRTFTKL